MLIIELDNGHELRLTLEPGVSVVSVREEDDEKEPMEPAPGVH